jgi:hypothetical protein
MRLLTIFLAAILFVQVFSACKGGGGPATFCDTACMNDTLKYIETNNPFEPYVYISAKDCWADEVIWSHADMGTIRKIGLEDVLRVQIKLNKDNVSCFFKDTSYAWLTFTDCMTGHGYALKIPFNDKDNISRKNAFNSFDPKFSVAPGLVVSTDKGNLFVEDMATGKKAMMTFGERIDMDYDNIHDYVESIKVTPTHISAKVKLPGGWKELEKDVVLE